MHGMRSIKVGLELFFSNVWYAAVSQDTTMYLMPFTNFSYYYPSLEA